MIDINCTILSSIMDKINRISLQAENDPSALKAILALIIVNDLIEWAEVLEDATKKEAMLVKLRNQFLRCYKQKLKICQTYNTDNDLIYSNVNTPQGNYDWDRIWDNPNVIILQPILPCAGLEVINLGKVIE